MNVKLMLILGVVLGAVMLEAAPQSASENDDDPDFTLPVQLIGFPVIIMAVRMANFLKKLTYTVNPRTYVARSRRSALGGPGQLREHLSHHYEGETTDVAHVEHQLVAELGPDVCLFEDICKRYAAKAHHGKHSPIDWEEIVRKYESMAGNRKKFYLLSVFLGDIVSSPKLCHQVAMRPGRSCN